MNDWTLKPPIAFASSYNAIAYSYPKGYDRLILKARPNSEFKFPDNISFDSNPTVGCFHFMDESVIRAFVLYPKNMFDPKAEVRGGSVLQNPALGFDQHVLQSKAGYPQLNRILV